MKDLELLKKEVERITGIPDISIKSRKIEYVHARALFFIIGREGESGSLNAVGRFVGKDHATVIHALKNKEQYLKDTTFRMNYHRLNPEDFERNLNEYEEQIFQLKQKIFVLNDKLKNQFSTGLRRSHSPLIEILNDIPDYHVETVRVRLQPIVRMLEKPSIHNYLPQKTFVKSKEINMEISPL